jgi:hypothetical protein
VTDIVYRGKINRICDPCYGHTVGVTDTGKLIFFDHDCARQVRALKSLDGLGDLPMRGCVFVLDAFAQLKHRRVRRLEKEIARDPNRSGRLQTTLAWLRTSNRKLSSHPIIRRIQLLERANILIPVRRDDAKVCVPLP